MDLKQIDQGLRRLFFLEEQRLVFWYDPEQSFTDELFNLDLPSVQVLDMDGESALGMKLKLELEDREGKYLLYFPHEEPEPEGDWLLDIKL